MKYKIIATPYFRKRIKKLAKKYSSLKEDFLQLIQTLEENPSIGIPLGNNCYKIRLKITSKNKGKSSGARVITNIVVVEKIVYLITIYDKSETYSISDSELKLLIEKNLS